MVNQVIIYTIFSKILFLTFIYYSVITGSSDHTIKLWKPHSSVDSKLNNTELVGVHSDYVKCLKEASNLDWLISAGLDGNIKIWDLHESPNRKISCLADPQNKTSIYALTSSPSGRLICSGSSDKILRLWDPRASNTAPISHFTGHTDNIRSLLMSDDGQWILSASSDTTIKLWSLQNQRCVTTFTHHSDSVWDLYSNDPNLKTFYSGGRDGMVFKTQQPDFSSYFGSEEYDLEEEDLICSVPVCQEQSGVNSIVGWNDHSIWTSTSSSSIHRWDDVIIEPEIYMLETSDYAELANQPNGDPNFTTSPTSGDASISQDGISPFPSLNGGQGPTPPNIPDLPAEVIKGGNGLTRCLILSNRRHVLTLDSAGIVALWDIIMCRCKEVFGNVDFEEKFKSLNPMVSVPNWCSVDAKIGALTVHLDEINCFDAEIYADELDLNQFPPGTDDYRVNLGKWMLGILFNNYKPKSLPPPPPPPPQDSTSNTQDKNTPSTANALGLTINTSNVPNTSVTSPLPVFNPDKKEPPSPFSVSLSNITPQPKSLLPVQPQSALNSANGQPKSLLADPSAPRPQMTRAYTTNYSNMTAVAASSSPPPEKEEPKSSPNHPAGENLPSIQPPPPSLSPSSTSIMGKLRQFSTKKINRSPENEKVNLSAKQQNSGDSSTLNTNDQANYSVNSPTQSTTLLNGNGANNQQENPNQPTSGKEADQSKSDSIHHNGSVENSKLPSNLMLSLPQIQLPPQTPIIFSEELAESTNSIDKYNGTYERLPSDMTEYQHLIPNWANNFISKGVRPHKDPVKIGFLLKPHSSSPLPNIPNGDTRLLANRVLRVRKLLMHIWEKLEMDREKLRHILYPNEKKSVSESDQNQEEESPLKVEDEIELLCNEQVSTNMI